MADEEDPLIGEVDRIGKPFITQMVGLLNTFPDRRHDIATSILGMAIGVCDMMGVNVEEFLVELRKQEIKPAVLVPPPRRKPS